QMADQKAKPEGDIFPFLSLPGELRNMIYGYAADWNDHNRVRTRVYAEIEERTKRFRKHPQRREELHNTLRAIRKPITLAILAGKLGIQVPALSTPIILLINRQVTAEALGVLRARPLTITNYYQLHALRFEIGTGLDDFISRRTLEAVTAVTIKHCIPGNLWSLLRSAIWRPRSALTSTTICLPKVYPPYHQVRREVDVETCRRFARFARLTIKNAIDGGGTLDVRHDQPVTWE
ncbi:hypothetical protein LTS18_005586, partial [Coniosporium uncinatum]